MVDLPPAVGRIAGGAATFCSGRRDDFIKAEGDPNYQASGATDRGAVGVRDYAETSLTRTFRLAPEVRLEASARVHRVEKDYGNYVSVSSP